MEHSMILNPEPFEMIRNKTKTIELRLYDDKRKGISSGDIICFHNSSNPQDVIRVKVESLHVYNSFDELYRVLPLLQCGYTKENIDFANPEDMDVYYSKEKQAQFGVVGIQIELI